MVNSCTFIRLPSAVSHKLPMALFMKQVTVLENQNSTHYENYHRNFKGNKV